MKGLLKYNSFRLICKWIFWLCNGECMDVVSCILLFKRDELHRSGKN